jgi:uncharacterized membrane protein YeaQ/YmgE (transglycosylase-associated protein family)
MELLGLVANVLAFDQSFHDRYFVMSHMHSLLGWILIGLIAGWLTGKLTHGKGFGCLGDVLLGMVGAVVGGWIFGRLGIWGGGFLFSLAAATVGAVVLVTIARLFSSHN